MKSLVPAEIIIEKKIFTIRDKKVILDKDLAELYGVKPIRLREQVKRNKERFPEDFMFQLTEKEAEILVSQNAIPSKKHLGGYLPYVFTEHGAIQAANVLNSARAVEMGVSVVRTFVRMREMIISHKDLAVRLDDLEKKYDTRFRFVFDAIKKLIDSPMPPTKPIGFLSEKEKNELTNSRIELALKEKGLVYVNDLKLGSAADVADIFRELKNQDREKFVTLMLNKDDEILGCEVVAVGTLDAAPVSARETLKIPVKIGASKIVLVHNHPSGNPEPSPGDVAATRNLNEAGKLTGIEVLYHVVLGKTGYSVINGTSNERYDYQQDKRELRYPIVEYEAMVERNAGEDVKISGPRDAVNFVRPLFNTKEPLAVVAFLNTQGQVESVQALGKSFDASWEKRLALGGVASNASSFIICANFDISSDNLKKLERNGKIMCTPMVDYITLDKNGGKDFISKKAEGMMDKISNKILSLSDRPGGANMKLDEARKQHKKNIDDAFKSAAGGNTINLSALMIGAEQIGQAHEEGKGVIDSPLGSDNWDESKNKAAQDDKRREDKVMMKVAERAAKGTYVARIIGVDERGNVQREFLKTELKFEKDGKGKGTADVFIDPETLKEGDIISMKVVRTAGDKPKENFYKIVADPVKNPELHNVVKKILGGKDEVVKMIMKNTLIDGRKFTGSNNLLAATDVAADKKSYVAKITGGDEKFGFRREFIGEHKRIEGGGDNKPRYVLEMPGGSIKEGDIVSVKVVKDGESPKDAKESFYRIEKDPSQGIQLSDIARKISRQEAAKAVGVDLERAGSQRAKDSAADSSTDKTAGLADARIGIGGGLIKGSYAAKITGPDEKFGLKREFIGRLEEGELTIDAGSVKPGDIIALKEVPKGSDPKDVKETFYKVVMPPAEEFKFIKDCVKEITRAEVAEDVKKNSEASGLTAAAPAPQFRGDPDDDGHLEPDEGSYDDLPDLTGEPKDRTKDNSDTVKDVASGRAKTYGRTM